MKKFNIPTVAILILLGLCVLFARMSGAAIIERDANAGEDSLASLRLQPLAQTWYATSEATGRWRVVGEVVFKNTSGHTLKVKGVSFDVFSSTGVMARRNYAKSEFVQMLFVVTRKPTGEIIAKPSGTTNVGPNDEVIALITNAQLTAFKPVSAGAGMRFENSPPAVIRMPVSTFQDSPQFRVPFTFQPNRFWAAINTAGTYSHWPAIYPQPVSGYFISQRYAVDFLQVNANGESSSPVDSADKQDYFAWNRSVRAAAPGTVVAMVNNRPDNEIGETDAQHPGGNYVVIRHSANIFTFYAHLQRGSIQVHAGEIVNKGRLLARVGNSGNTSEPHLHFHVMDGWDNLDPVLSLYRSQGLPALFWNALVYRSGKTFPINGRCLAELDVILPPQ